MKRIDAHLYLLFTPENCLADPWETLRAAIQGGVDLVQWRRKEQDQSGLERCREICTARAVPLIINDDVEVATQLDLAGAHIGQDDMPADQARDLLGTQRWLGISTHTLDQLRVAEAAGADYLGFGPIYPTSTKGYREGLGDAALAAALAATDLPIFAIGGIDADNLSSLVSRGCPRIAVSGCILNAEDPELAARALSAQL